MRFEILFLTLSILVGLPACAAEKEDVPSWLPGIWQMTADEDKGPLGELVEFTPDGRYFFYGKYCLSMEPIHFHIHKGNVYVTNTIPGKGPVSVIFHPVNGNSTLTFTSPRTFNNATYSKTKLKACEKQG
jgi:hypothetical protein